MLIFRISNYDKDLLQKIYDDVNMSLISSQGFIDGYFKTSDILYENDVYYFDIQLGEESFSNITMRIISMKIDYYRKRLS